MLGCRPSDPGGLSLVCAGVWTLLHERMAMRAAEQLVSEPRMRSEVVTTIWQGFPCPCDVPRTPSDFEPLEETLLDYWE